MPVTQTIASGLPVGELPFNATGSLFGFALVRGESTTFSDDMSDLVGAIIPGYSAVTDDEEALLARWRCAAATATEVQQLIAAANGLDPSVESEDTLTALFTDRGELVPDGLIGPGGWTHQVPLVLLATDYEPFTSTPKPGGNIQWLDSSTERAFLRTLSDLGVCMFYTHDTVVAAT
jgi:hypothetical protein